LLRVMMKLLSLGFDATRLTSERAEKRTVQGWTAGGGSPGLQEAQRAKAGDTGGPPRQGPSGLEPAARPFRSGRESRDKSHAERDRSADAGKQPTGGAQVSVWEPHRTCRRHTKARMSKAGRYARRSLETPKARPARARLHYGCVSGCYAAIRLPFVSSTSGAARPVTLSSLMICAML